MPAMELYKLNQKWEMPFCNQIQWLFTPSASHQGAALASSFLWAFCGWEITQAAKCKPMHTLTLYIFKTFTIMTGLFWNECDQGVEFQRDSLALCLLIKRWTGPTSLLWHGKLVTNFCGCGSWQAILNTMFKVAVILHVIHDMHVNLHVIRIYKRI